VHVTTITTGTLPFPEYDRFVLEPVSDGKAFLRLAGASQIYMGDRSGTLVMTHSPTITANFSWDVVDAGAGLVTITSFVGHQLAVRAGPAGVGWRVVLVQPPGGTGQAWTLVDAGGADVCQAGDASGDRVVSHGWMEPCDQGVLKLDHDLKWHRWRYDARNVTSGPTAIDSPISCTSAYDQMHARWEQWKDTVGARFRRDLEAEAYNQQFAVMQQAYKEWKEWEVAQSVYIAEKVEIQECAMNVTSGEAITGVGALLSGFAAEGHRSDDCRLAGCELSQCVVKKSSCLLGQPTGDVEYECADRIRTTKKRLDEVLIGIFAFLLSCGIFAISPYTDDPARSRVEPDLAEHGAPQKKGKAALAFGVPHLNMKKALRRGGNEVVPVDAEDEADESEAKQRRPKGKWPSAPMPLAIPGQSGKDEAAKNK